MKTKSNSKNSVKEITSEICDYITENIKNDKVIVHKFVYDRDEQFDITFNYKWNNDMMIGEVTNDGSFDLNRYHDDCLYGYIHLNNKEEAVDAINYYLENAELPNEEPC